MQTRKSPFQLEEIADFKAVIKAAYVNTKLRRSKYKVIFYTDDILTKITSCESDLG